MSGRLTWIIVQLTASAAVAEPPGGSCPSPRRAEEERKREREEEKEKKGRKEKGAKERKTISLILSSKLVSKLV
jgi:ribosomal protein L12E/L44/L45/RPP1/RPP2